jgi:DNA-binding IclR family transcriptional regulator
METTLVKGLQVLATLAIHPELSGVTELALHLGMTKSNAHRLLQTLAACGYVRNVKQSGKYEPTLKLWELGTAIADRLDIAKYAEEGMRSLSQRCRETIHLSVLEGGQVMYLDKIESPQPVRAYSRVGGRAPAYCVATGKALLAYAPDDLVGEISTQLEAFTASTIVTPQKLKKELEGVRKMGYAINRGEWRDGVCGVAAPIWDAEGKVCAAIGVSGPADQFKPRNLKTFGLAVSEVAAEISTKLGYHGRQR